MPDTLDSKKEQHAIALLTELTNQSWNAADTKHGRGLISTTLPNDALLTLCKLRDAHALGFAIEEGKPIVVRYNLNRLETFSDKHQGKDLDAGIVATAALIKQGVENGTLAVSLDCENEGRVPALKIERVANAKTDAEFTALHARYSNKPGWLVPEKTPDAALADSAHFNMAALSNSFTIGNTLTVRKLGKQLETIGAPIAGLNEAVQGFIEKANPNLKTALALQDSQRHASRSV